MKTAQVSVLLAALAAGSTASPVQHAKRDFDCDGPYIIAARGSGEAPGEGVQSQVVGMIEGGISGWSGSDTGLDYPAVVNDNNGNYGPSVVAGIQNLNNLITSYVGQCGSGSKIVLLGYSQGGQVVSSLLGGGSGQPALASQYTQNIAAAVVFGDPTFILGQSYDAGSSNGNGVISGQGGTPETLAPYVNVFRSFCTANDAVCASGQTSDSGTIHEQEITAWAQDATDFIIPLIS